MTLLFKNAYAKRVMLLIKGLALFCNLSLIAACGSTSVDDNPKEASKDSVNIGLAVSLVIFGKGFGQDMFDAATLAADEINASGGVNGQPIRIIARDTACDGEIAQFEVQALIDDFDVQAIVGPVCSSATVALNNITSSAGLPLISLYATSPEVTSLEDNDTIYRMEPSDTAKGRLYAEIMINEGIQRLGVIFRDEPFNGGLAEIVREAFEDESAGRSIVSYIPYDEEKTVDFSAEVNSLLAPGDLEAIAIFGFADSAANITLDLEIAGAPANIKYFFSDPTPELARQGAPNIIEDSRGVFLSEQPLEGNDNYTIYLNNFLNVSPGGVPFNGVLAYDAVYLHALAMLKGGANTKAAIVQNLRSVSGTAVASDAVIIGPNQFSAAVDAINIGLDVDYEGASGSINWDENGDVNYGTYAIEQAVRVGSSIQYQTVDTIILNIEDSL